MSLANKRQEMMLAQTRQRYVADQYRYLARDSMKPTSRRRRVLAQAREEARVGVGDALGGARDVRPGPRLCL